MVPNDDSLLWIERICIPDEDERLDFDTKIENGRFLSQNSMYLANFLSIAERWCSASIVGYGKSGLDAQEIVLRVRCSKFRMRNFSCLFNKPQSNQAADAPRRRIQ